MRSQHLFSDTSVDQRLQHERSRGNRLAVVQLDALRLWCDVAGNGRLADALTAHHPGGADFRVTSAERGRDQRHDGDGGDNDSDPADSHGDPFSRRLDGRCTDSHVADKAADPAVSATGHAYTSS